MVAEEIEGNRRQGVSNVPPDIPRVDRDELEISTRETFYIRLRDNPDAQPRAVRRIIWSEGELTRSELNQYLKSEGYDPSGSGSVDETITVLEEVTEEIERREQGGEQRIVWVGG